MLRPSEIGVLEDLLHGWGTAIFFADALVSVTEVQCAILYFVSSLTSSTQKYVWKCKLPFVYNFQVTYICNVNFIST